MPSRNGFVWLNSKCIDWAGVISKTGYAVCNKGMKAYRVARILYFGAFPETEKTFVVDHICRNRRCINLAHLRAITSKENTLCGIGFAAINKKKTHCKWGHKLSGYNLVRDKRNGGRTCRMCRKYQTNKSSGHKTEHLKGTRAS